MRLKLVQRGEQDRPVRIREQAVQFIFELRKARTDSAQYVLAPGGYSNGKGASIFRAAPALEIAERLEFGL